MVGVDEDVVFVLVEELGCFVTFHICVTEVYLSKEDRGYWM